MLERQKIILALTDGEPNHRISRLKLVKLCFLIAQEWRAPASSCLYQFVPYLHGPFSFTLYHELDALIRDGELNAEGDNNVVRAEKRPPVTLKPESREVVRDVLRRYNRAPISRLVNDVYSGHTWFTLNSEQAERRAAQRPETPCLVYAAGYEGTQVDGFLNRLLENGIHRIIDVRANPLSRKYGFYKQTLARISGNVGIEYVHIPELGIPAAWRSELGAAVNYAAVFKRYEREILPAMSAQVAQVGRMVTEKPSVLICMEADPALCHRSRLAQAVSRLIGLPAQDLGMESCNG